jgi:hypothetical protein
VTPAERQAIRDRAEATFVVGWTSVTVDGREIVTEPHIIAMAEQLERVGADVFALDAELIRAEEEIRRLNHEAAALEAETRSLRGDLVEISLVDDGDSGAYARRALAAADAAAETTT